MILGSPANPLPFFNLERVRAMSLSCLVKTIFLFFLFAELVVTSLAVTTPVKGVSSGARVRKTRLHRFQSSEIHENAVVTQATTSRPVTGFDESPIIYYFDQLIDHNNPSLGTFTQRYWQSWEWYKPGKHDHRCHEVLPESLTIRNNRWSYHLIHCRRRQLGT